VNNTTLLLLNPLKDTITISHEAAYAPGEVWTGAENLALNIFAEIDLCKLDWCNIAFLIVLYLRFKS
jgi:hypothetical protein